MHRVGCDRTSSLIPPIEPDRKRALPSKAIHCYDLQVAIYIHFNDPPFAFVTSRNGEEILV